MFIIKEVGGVQYNVANDKVRSMLSRFPDCAAAAARGDGIIAPWWKSLLCGPFVATNDFRDVRQLATVDKTGFVVVEPAEGWQNVDESVSEVSPMATLTVVACISLVIWLL